MLNRPSDIGAIVGPFRYIQPGMQIFGLPRSVPELDFGANDI